MSLQSVTASARRAAIKKAASDHAIARRGITDPESVVRRLVDDSGNAIEYHSHNEAVTAIKAAAGIGR